LPQAKAIGQKLVIRDTMRAGAAGLIFDLDGLLIDSEGLQYRAYSEVLARFGVTVSPQEYAAKWIATGGGPEYAVRTYELPLSPDELRALKDPVYHELLHREICLMPGALDAVRRLHDGFPLAVATNSNDRDTRFVLERLGLLAFFDAVVTREQYERPKPNPDAFLTAAARLGVPPARCIVVEDTCRGVLAAHRAGALPVAVPNAFTRDNDFSLAARVLAHLDELTANVIEELLARRGFGP
jgi:HAD superfamily hydrolase (TIGR01509 family)